MLLSTLLLTLLLTVSRHQRKNDRDRIHSRLESRYDLRWNNLVLRKLVYCSWNIKIEWSLHVNILLEKDWNDSIDHGWGVIHAANSRCSPTQLPKLRGLIEISFLVMLRRRLVEWNFRDQIRNQETILVQIRRRYTYEKLSPGNVYTLTTAQGLSALIHKLGIRLLMAKSSCSRWYHLNQLG